MPQGLGKITALIGIGVFLQLAAIGVFITTHLFWEQIPCWVKKLPGMEKKLRYCHYSDQELSALISRMKHEEDNLSSRIRKEEEEFQERAWQLSEAARNERKEVAIAEPAELTHLRLNLVELGENLKALQSSQEGVRFLAAAKTPVRWGSLALFLLGELLLLAGIFKILRMRAKARGGESLLT